MKHVTIQCYNNKAKTRKARLTKFVARVGLGTI